MWGGTKMDDRKRRSAKKRFTVAFILVTAMLLAACTNQNVSKTEETQETQETQLPVLTENGHEEEQTAPGETAESVQDIKQTEQPTGGQPQSSPLADSNAEVLTFPLGSSVELDLDGDGTPEELEIFKADSAPGSVNCRLDDMVYDEKYLLDEMGVYLENPGDEYYIITWGDGSRSVGLFDQGPSDDPAVSLLCLESGGLRYEGSFTGYISADYGPHAAVLKGDKTVYSRKRLQLLQTWWAEGMWRPDSNGIMTEVIRELYVPYAYEGSALILNTDLELYREMDRQSETLTVPKGAALLCTGTDDINWIGLRSDSGESGWVYMKNFCDMVLPDGSAVNAQDVFGNLNMAD
jgi:hypothetical protein